MAVDKQESGQPVRISARAKEKLDAYLAKGVRPGQQAVLSALVEWFVDLDDPTRYVPLGQKGEMCIQGPNVMKGYWNKPEATADTVIDGWLHTGDVGKVDADGFVYVLDRAKDMIIRGGENVYCAEVEDVLSRHPDVVEAAVVGVRS